MSSGPKGSSIQNALHRAELFGQLVDFFGVLLDALKPAIRFLNLPLDLQRVLGRIENRELGLGGCRRQKVTDEHAEQETLEKLFHYCFLSTSSVIRLGAQPRFAAASRRSPSSHQR